MDPVTNALSSWALARAGLQGTSRLATVVLVVTGVALDLDLLTFVAGPAAYLQLHRALTHSIAGSLVLALLLSAAFLLFSRRRAAQPINFLRIFLLACAAAALHILLDLCTSDGVALLWPFRSQRYQWDIAAEVDLWILALLLAALLLPALFSLVSEEIGERRKRRRAPMRGAIAGLAVLTLYLGWRAAMHAEVLNLMLAREYQGAAPLAAGAFPSSTSPFEWRGIVITSNTLDELSVPLGPAASFDPERGLLHYKPEPSPILTAAQSAPVARQFLAWARFPLAEITRLEGGYRFILRDLRFPADSRSLSNITASIDLDAALHVTAQNLEFPNSHPALRPPPSPTQ